jgi:hypothetical protein
LVQVAVAVVELTQAPLTRAVLAAVAAVLEN